ncbi:GNAT family N-acetyltransferase [Microbacterium sp. LMI12-1-1.1]|uniref:GNAT family N-acetyltransferase n=1 Tax=Microbacterium sp. LMI12-1-1.1 TaxID=3135225 RepID=UPI003442118A
MTIEVRPATVFEDVAALVGPKNPASNVCFCLSYRIPAKEATALRGPERAERVRRLMDEEGPIGVLAYDGDEPVGWAAVAPRTRTHFATFRKIPHVDDLDAWSLWCFRVRPGHRKQGVMHALVDGAVDFARTSGAPAIEGYPVDNGDARVDLTMAYVGTQRLFEQAGFVKAADTTSVLSGFPRVLMRLEL